jgi:hypothetical protein
VKILIQLPEFYKNENAHVVENYLRFGVTRTDEALEQAKERLRALKEYMVDEESRSCYM